MPPDVVQEEAARGASGVAQRAASGDAGGHRRSSEKVRIARPGTKPETTMTDDRMTLMELVEKSADEDLVRDMLACAAERLMEMEMEVEAATGAPKGARTSARTAQRDGYRDRGWESRAGRIDLAIPGLRKGSYFPSFLEPRRTAEKALVALAIGLEPMAP